MLKVLVSLSLLTGYASAGCAQTDGKPVDICWVESRTSAATDGSATIVAKKYVCSTDGSTVTLKTYSDILCVTETDAGTATPCTAPDCTCGDAVCSYVKYQTNTICADGDAYTAGTIAAVGCVATSDGSSEYGCIDASKGGCYTGQIGQPCTPATDPSWVGNIFSKWQAGIGDDFSDAACMTKETTTTDAPTAVTPSPVTYAPTSVTPAPVVPPTDAPVAYCNVWSPSADSTARCSVDLNTVPSAANTFLPSLLLLFIPFFVMVGL